MRVLSLAGTERANRRHGVTSRLGKLVSAKLSGGINGGIVELRMAQTGQQRWYRRNVTVALLSFTGVTNGCGLVKPGEGISPGPGISPEPSSL